MTWISRLWRLVTFSRACILIARTCVLSARTCALNVRTCALSVRTCALSACTCALSARTCALRACTYALSARTCALKCAYPGYLGVLPPRLCPGFSLCVVSESLSLKGISFILNKFILLLFTSLIPSIVSIINLGMFQVGRLCGRICPRMNLYCTPGYVSSSEFSSKINVEL